MDTIATPAHSIQISDIIVTDRGAFIVHSITRTTNRIILVNRKREDLVLSQSELVNVAQR